MCGIAGIYIPKGRPVPEVSFSRIAEVMKHRGPDGEGYWESPDKRYRTIFRRLAIIDLATGEQPLRDPESGRVLTGNGEIYNYLELRQSHQSYPYKTNGDMESVLAARQIEGSRYLEQLNGMYAFALYDPRTDTLELVRDRLGVKPLYWATLPSGGIIYASEIKPLLVSGLIHPEVSEDTVSAYLAHGYVPGPDTLFKGIFKLQPGHALSIDADGETIIRPYWQAKAADDLPSGEEARNDHLLNLLEESVRMQLRSDVPVGVLLSGGLDSGMITALAARNSSKALNTYTARFADGVDETPLAKQVSEKYGTDHHVIDVDASDAGKHLWSLAWYTEEPLNDAAVLPNFLVEKALGEHVTVSLNGTGGDELFAGYGRYFQLPIEQRYMHIPEAIRSSLIEPLVSMMSPMRAWQLQRASFYLTDRGQYLHEHSTHFPAPIRSIIGNSMPAPLARQSLIGAAFQRAHPGCDLQTIGLAADIGSYLPEDLLTLLDRTSMAVSVEGRVPMLDHRFVEATLAVPEGVRAPDGAGKTLQRKLAGALLPEDIIGARKQGFVSPVPKWFAGNVGRAAERLLTSKQSLERGWWTAEGIRQLMSQPDRHGYRVYSLLMLELAVRSFIENPIPSSAPEASLMDVADAA